MTSRATRIGMWIALAVVALVVVGAAVDLSRTGGRAPDVPARCQPSTPQCELTRNGSLQFRRQQIGTLEQDFAVRALGYDAAAGIAGTVALALALNGRNRRQRQVLFERFGVASVIVLVATLVLLLRWGNRLFDLPVLAIWIPGIAMAVVAGGGTVLTRLAATEEGPATQPRDPAEQDDTGEDETAAGSDSVDRAASRRRSLVLLVATYLFALTTFALSWWVILRVEESGCVDSCELAPWRDEALGVAAVCWLAALLVGGAGLYYRRWITFLLCVGGTGFWLLVAMFAGIGS